MGWGAAARRAILAAVGLALAGPALAQDAQTPPPVAPASAAPASASPAPAAPAGLRVAVADGAKPVFDAFIADVTAPGRFGVPVDVSSATPEAALQAFCQNDPAGSPDILLAPQRMRPSAAADCARNGVRDIAALELGRSALVLAVRKGSLLTRLNSQQVYLALARDVPYNNEFHRNVSVRWSDIDRDLPPQDIRFQLPPHEDGSRATFDTLILGAGCRAEPMVMQIANAQKRTARCVTLRTDREREIPRDQAVRSLLDAPEGTVGVLTVLEVEQSGGALVGVELDGVAPTREVLQQAVYDHASALFLYAKRGSGPGADPRAEAVEQVLARAQDEAMIGPDGILAKRGMAPLPPDQRAAQRAALAPPPPYGLVWMRDWAYSIAGGAWYLLSTTFQRDRGQGGPGASDLTSLMGLAGYKLQEFDSSVGIVPSAVMTFGVVREMSDADREALDRALEYDARARTDALSAIQRRIVRAVIDVGETEGYAVSRVELTLLPLPEVRLIVSVGGGE